MAALMLAPCADARKRIDSNNFVNGFTYSNGTVTWQTVYYDCSQRRLQWYENNFIVTESPVKKFIGNKTSIEGKTGKILLPYILPEVMARGEAGYLGNASLYQRAWNSCPNIDEVLKNPCYVYFKTCFTKNKVTTVVSDIVWYKDGGTMTLNDLAVINGEFDSEFYATTSFILNYALTALFISDKIRPLPAE